MEIEHAEEKKARELAFLEEYSKLCEKHGLIAVPTHQLMPSAHDPLAIVKFSDSWQKFLERTLTSEDLAA